jgi:hypothetical protein
VVSKGIALESSYPYASADQTCKAFTPQKVITNVCYLQYINEDTLKTMLLKAGPLAIAISEFELTDFMTFDRFFFKMFSRVCTATKMEFILT